MSVTSKAPNPEKGRRYLALLDQALCNGNWAEVPELARKADKHAPERGIFTLTARTEAQIASASHRPTSAASSGSVSIHSLGDSIPKLQEAVSGTSGLTEDKHCAAVCLAEILWLRADATAALKALSEQTKVGTSSESHTPTLGWLEISSIKSQFIHLAALEATGSREELDSHYRRAIASTPGTRTPELRRWTERVLARACMYYHRQIESPSLSKLNETLVAFRAWSSFWQRAPKPGAPGARSDSGSPSIDIPRRVVWKAYYDVLSVILQYGLMYLPSDSGSTPLGVHSGGPINERYIEARQQQRAEFQMVEETYESLLLNETQFPRSNQTNTEVESWVEEVIGNWKVFAGPSWTDAELGGEGGKEAAGRRVLDILYRAATKTFHSTTILRQLFTVHAALGEFELAMHAFDSYVEIVGKGKAREEKTGKHELGFDTDDVAILTACDALRVLCRYGDREQAEKAMGIVTTIHHWLDEQRPITEEETLESDDNKAGEAPRPKQPTHGQLLPPTLAAAYRSTAATQAHWARSTFQSESRSSLLSDAIGNLREAQSYDADNIETAYALSRLLAETRQIPEAIQVIQRCIARERHSTGDEDDDERDKQKQLIQMWHLLSQCLTARDEYDPAMQMCAAAFDQFGESQVLFGRIIGGRQTRGVIDSMDTLEKEAILEVKMSQITFIELTEGPQAGVDRSQELLGLYNRLFGALQQPKTAFKQTTAVAQPPPPRTSGTLRSIVGSIRPQTARRNGATAPSNDNATLARKRAGSSQPAPMGTDGQATGAPIAITVTNEDGASDEKEQSHDQQQHHLHLPFKIRGHAGSLHSKKSREDFSEKQGVNGTNDGRAASARVTTEPRSPPSVSGPPQLDGAVQSSDFAQGGHQPLREMAHNTSPDVWPPPAGHSDQPPEQDVRLPAPHPSVDAQPMSHSESLHERQHKTSMLVGVWLFIAGLYVRAEFYDDAQGAIIEAYGLVETFEAEKATAGANARKLFEKGWGAGKSVDTLWGDVYAAKGALATARDLPFQAIEHYEKSLLHFPDHPQAIIGLSNLLMDIYEQKLPAEEPRPLLPPQPTASGSLMLDPAIQQTTDSRPTTAKTTLATPGRAPPSVVKSQDPTPQELNRLAARDRAYMLLSNLTRLGSGWDDSEAWFTLARAHELSGQVEKAKQALWWVVELEDSKPMRPWRTSMDGTDADNVQRRRSAMYRRESNVSTASFMVDVEMASEDIFSGPMSESVPTATSAFSHRRSRADSNASFHFYDDDDLERDEDEGDSAILEEAGDGVNGDLEAGVYLGEDEEETAVEEDGSISVDGRRRYSGDSAKSSRKSSGGDRRGSGRSRASNESRRSARAPLLRRHHSGASGDSRYREGGRLSQKIYIVTEDMTIVVAGFQTSVIGFAVYLCLCILTGGLGYLILRWLPKWYVRVVGRAVPLGEADWVVVENQWGEMAVQDLNTQEFGQSLSAVFGTGNDKGKYSDYDEYDDPIMDELKILDYRYIRFCYHPLKDKFVLGNTWKDPTWTDVTAVRSGIDSDEQEIREGIFGKNAIDIEQKTTGQLLLDEAFHPFYVFQIASLILWSLDTYYYYAACIFVISVVSITTTLIETKATMQRLREISRFECDIRVLRGGFWRSIDSSELVPGDVYEVTDPNLGQFPCDSLLLSGDCIVNESMLTGESVPVSKTPAVDETLEALNLSASTISADVAKHMLFSGTKIVRARRPQDDKTDEAAALALVVRTGFNTTKGALVRSMLFPKPSGFKFYRDSFRYISVMAMIAGVGFIASFINFIRLGLQWHLIVVRALDLITIVVPPALPATLTIGTNFALQRLKSKLIFCISPQRVNVGGKIDVMCFDKTGTLTEDGLDVLGVRVVSRPANRFSELLEDSSKLLPGGQYERDPTIDYNANKAILYTMATCHSLRIVEDEFIGDPLDLKMFEFTGWQYEEGTEHSGGNNEDDEDLSLSPSVARPPPGMEFDLDEEEGTPQSRRPIELGVLKQFEFVSQLRRASVVVRQFGEKSGDVYVKGAPEAMKDICRSDSFPPDYDELLAYYTHRGFRVIAVASKHIFKLNWLKVQKMKREEAESNLEFVGFIIFENKLKDRTTEVIEELADANIRTVMCTGDNILTAISVARECNLIDKSAHCFAPHFVEGGPTTPLSKLVWESVDNPVYQLDENSLKPLPPPAEHDSSLPYDVSNLRHYSVAVTGDVFRWIIDFASPKVLREMLAVGQVYARMSPDEKAELIEKLQSIDYTAGFCGDGANDCGALKAPTWASRCRKPKPRRVFDISCVPEVIREGRAALVTSFSCFKYMSLYSAIQFTSVSFLYASASNLGDFQFLYIDLLLILPIAIFMGWTGPYPTLSRKRPTASLVSRKVLVPLLGQIALVILTQLLGWLLVRHQPWYQPPILDPSHSNAENSENSTLFLLSCYQYILSAVVLSVGKPFRQSMAHNLPFVVALAVSLAVSAYMLFDPAPWLQRLMELTWMSNRFRLAILVIGVGYFVVSGVLERSVFPVVARAVGRVRRGAKRRKQYKVILEGMRI
ncbi:putative cation-transporting ATPase [Teratosphaeria destructans]|uniref:Cation-transporting ATPase n=1 Tax=Teratosphaeria destructans TaxID=418781 RepID=A0A9W7SUV7_9PEZI|nr:putative cation-transporting ATPase [Teratosphaeria destructans]